MRFQLSFVTLRTGAASIIASTLCACAGTPSATVTNDPVAVSKSAIVVVDSPRWDFRWDSEWSGAETGLADCLISELADRQNQYDLLPSATFKRVAFPNLSADHAPDSPEYVKLALTHPDVQKRLQALRVKYMIYIAGTTEVTHDWGDVACGFGAGAGGCAGMVVADQTSELSAMIMDIQASGNITNVMAATEGKNWLVVLGILPIWNQAPTRRAACEVLANKVIEKL
jgi:hypothetical protein